MEEQIKNIFDDITKRIQEKEDNAIAKAFTSYIGICLIKEGIVPIMTKVETSYEECFSKDEYTIISRYGYKFDRIDTSEHDKQVINKYKYAVKEDVLARLKARKHYLTDDEYRQEIEATRNMISSLDYLQTR